MANKTLENQHPLFHEALIITCTGSDERCDAIREIGAELYRKRRSTSALRELMEACIEYRPDLQNELLGQFNGALDGIGGWRS